jgi:hypothetical protein
MASGPIGTPAKAKDEKKKAEARIAFMRSPWKS